VVLSGQFLIDSEASLSAAISRLEGSPAAGPQSAHKGTGTVRAVDAPSGYVELDHDPIASMKWPQMVMGFYAEDKAQLGKLKEGDKVDFDVYPKPNKEGDFILQRIVPRPAR
jgi:Cu/Ag efflux protein CusF